MTRLFSERALAGLAELRETDLAAVAIEWTREDDHGLLDLQPPATAGMMLTSSVAATGVARSSR